MNYLNRQKLAIRQNLVLKDWQSKITQIDTIRETTKKKAKQEDVLKVIGINKNCN